MQVTSTGTLASTSWQFPSDGHIVGISLSAWQSLQNAATLQAYLGFIEVSLSSTPSTSGVTNTAFATQVLAHLKSSMQQATANASFADSLNQFFPIIRKIQNQQSLYLHSDADAGQNLQAYALIYYSLA